MRIVAVCLLAAACASPQAVSRSQSGPVRLLAGAPIVAPQGVLDYCARAPHECGGETRDVLRGRLPATGAPSFQRASFSPRATQSDVFAALMAARRADPGPALHRSRRETAMTAERWAELRSVNIAVNRAIRAATDMEAYGLDEYWTRPLLSGGGGRAVGDCEDYALEKRARLIALGWAPEAVNLAIAVAPGVGLHAVLVVQTSEGDIVLDNLYREPRRLGSLPYTWLSRQTGGNLADWALARVESAAGAPAVRSYASPEQMFQQMMNERRQRSVEHSGQQLALAQSAPQVESDVAPLSVVRAPEQQAPALAPATDASVESRAAPSSAVIRPRPRMRDADLCLPR